MSRQQRQPQSRTPRYLLEDVATGLYVAATDDGPQLAKRLEATEYRTHADAQIAAGAQPLEVVRVDA